MGEADPNRYALGRLILDYLRVFIWPAAALSVVLLYQEDVRDILRSREVEFAGVFKIGQQVKQIEERAQEEIADIRALLDAQRSGEGASTAPVTADIESKLDNLTRNISRDVTQIQQVAPLTTQTLPAPPADTAPTSRAQLSPADLERAGFQALLERNIGEAIANFDGAFNLYPEFHNVAEIRQYLRERQQALEDRNADAWGDLYRTILAKFSWGLPSDLRPRLRELAKESYLK